MNKTAIIFIVFSLLFISIPAADNQAPADLSSFRMGGKIVSPPSTYRSGSDQPAATFRNFLEKLGDFLKANTHLILDIRGHSDNTGTDPVNARISTRRAKSAEEIILKNSGIRKDRIIARGYADRLPIKNNTNESGRSANRRVELILTHNVDPVGEITHIRNSVFTKSPVETDFKKARIAEALFNLYKLNTRKRSGADIRLADNSRLNIGPESLMVLYEMIESELSDPAAWQDKKVTLLTGFLRTKLNNLRKGIRIETPQCEINSGSRIMLLNISPEQRSAISVFEGETSVKAENRSVNVPSGFGTSVEQGKAPEKPEPLPEAPELVSPVQEQSFTHKTGGKKNVELKWNSGETLNHLQISEDAEFTKITVDEKISGQVFKAELPKGTFHWRVAGISGSGIEGFPAQSRFSIIIQKEGLPIQSDPPAMATPLEAHGSTIYVHRNSFTLTGATEPGTVLAIHKDNVDVGPDGTFKKELMLNWGWNLIQVEAVHQNYKPVEKWISICYFKKKIK